MAKYEIVATASGEGYLVGDVVGVLETDQAPFMLLEGERTGKFQYRSPDAPVPKDEEPESQESTGDSDNSDAQDSESE